MRIHVRVLPSFENREETNVRFPECVSFPQIPEMFSKVNGYEVRGVISDSYLPLLCEPCWLMGVLEPRTCEVYVDSRSGVSTVGDTALDLSTAICVDAENPESAPNVFIRDLFTVIIKSGLQMRSNGLSTCS